MRSSSKRPLVDAKGRRRGRPRAAQLPQHRSISIDSSATCVAWPQPALAGHRGSAGHLQPVRSPSPRDRAVTRAFASASTATGTCWKPTSRADRIKRHLAAQQRAVLHRFRLAAHTRWPPVVPRTGRPAGRADQPLCRRTNSYAYSDGSLLVRQPTQLPSLASGATMPPTSFVHRIRPSNPVQCTQWPDESVTALQPRLTNELGVIVVLGSRGWRC